MARITTFDTLKDALGDWMERDEFKNAGASDAITDVAVDLFESRFNRKLRTLKMETRATASLSGEYLGHPSNFGGIRHIRINGNPRHTLMYLTTTHIDRRWAGSQTARPQAFTIVGDEFRFAPRPDTTYTVEITYYLRLPALTDSNTSNWLLDDHPDIYLNGVLLEMEAHIYNDERLPMLKLSLDERLRELFKMDRRDRWSGAPLHTQSDVGMV